MAGKDQPEHDVLLGIAGDVKAIREQLAGDGDLQGVPKRCATHQAYLRSQWFHIRGLWSAFGALALLLIGAAVKVIWFKGG